MERGLIALLLPTFSRGGRINWKHVSTPDKYQRGQATRLLWILKLLLFYFSFWMEDKRGLNKHGQAAAAPLPMEGQHTSVALQRGVPRKEKLYTPHLSWLTRSPRNSNFWLDTQRHCGMRREKEKHSRIDASHV